MVEKLTPGKCTAFSGWHLEKSNTDESKQRFVAIRKESAAGTTEPAGSCDERLYPGKEGRIFIHALRNIRPGNRI